MVSYIAPAAVLLAIAGLAEATSNPTEDVPPSSSNLRNLRRVDNNDDRKLYGATTEHPSKFPTAASSSWRDYGHSSKNQPRAKQIYDWNDDGWSDDYWGPSKKCIPRSSMVSLFVAADPPAWSIDWYNLYLQRCVQSCVYGKRS